VEESEWRGGDGEKLPSRLYDSKSGMREFYKLLEETHPSGMWMTGYWFVLILQECIKSSLDLGTRGGWSLLPSCFYFGWQM
jgi:hypothetical protein